MTWHIANTTVRTPYRLKQAIQVLLDTGLNGDLAGAEQEYAFARALHDNGVLYSKKISTGARDTNVNSIGRKWRSALSQLGFITHNIHSASLKNLDVTKFGFEYSPNIVTPLGMMLAETETISGQQECFLRSLLAYKIPSIIEQHYNSEPFCPLTYTLSIIKELQKHDTEDSISFDEIALFIQNSTPDSGVDSVCDSILAHRRAKEAHPGNIRNFKKREYDRIAKLLTATPLTAKQLETKKSTLQDYADLTIRYLKGTGLFKTKGRGITINPLKKKLADLIASTPDIPLDNATYLAQLWKGAPLPTDDPRTALDVVENLKMQLEEKGIETGLTTLQHLNIAQLSDARYQLEDELSKIDEEAYYRNQAKEIDEILAWLKAVRTGKAVPLNDQQIIAPKAERPAYLEWVIWRAFLAINSLTNKPWEARRFRIDQDFLPVGTAPGNGPDMFFEFENHLIVTEVTLTQSSRQEAAEGESVRRHVAEYCVNEKANGKKVYGLFIAPTIDINTANTFKNGKWFTPTEEEIPLSITPLNLEDFERLLAAGRKNPLDLQKHLIELFDDCIKASRLSTPDWKRSISDIVTTTISKITQHDL